MGALAGLSGVKAVLEQSGAEDSASSAEATTGPGIVILRKAG